VATVNITVNPFNDAPVVEDVAVTVDEDGSIEVSFVGSDVDGDALTYVLDQALKTAFSRTASTRRMPITAARQLHLQGTDGSTESAAATVTITVTPTNDARRFRDRLRSPPPRARRSLSARPSFSPMLPTWTATP